MKTYHKGNFRHELNDVLSILAFYKLHVTRCNFRVLNFDMHAIQTVSGQEIQTVNDNFLLSEPTLIEASYDVPTVTKITLDTSTPSDDATTVVSLDMDSLHSKNISPEHVQKPAIVKLETRSSCTNSTDSMVSETFDSRSYTVRNSTLSEVGK